ncbi:MAG: hypothetical protein PHC64_01480 [Candidatus Gastranaerophilales bacterium]|nr:hypothetical protein [Candidatus Gastranaerophilales bacterium]
MKKIILAGLLFFMAQSLVVADEIIDSKGNITPCKVVTVMNGLIEYKKDGSLYNFEREKDSLIYNDYVDVRDKFFKNAKITRYTGKIVVKDVENVILRNENGDVNIPWYRVKFIGIYKNDY